MDSNSCWNVGDYVLLTPDLRNISPMQWTRPAIDLVAGHGVLISAIMLQ